MIDLDTQRTVGIQCRLSQFILTITQQWTYR